MQRNRLEAFGEGRVGARPVVCRVWDKYPAGDNDDEAHGGAEEPGKGQLGQVDQDEGSNDAHCDDCRVSGRQRAGDRLGKRKREMMVAEAQRA